jgi:hypothetical protein
MHSLREMLHSLRAAPGFALALLITLAAAAFNGLAVFQPALIGGVIDMSDMHFVGAQHRTHDLAFGFLFLPGVVGIFAQFRRPSKNVAGQLMAVIPSAALLLTLVLTVVLTNNTTVLQPPWVTVMTSALIATTLHPAGRDFFRSFSDGRTSWVMLALVIIAAVPLLVFASTNLGLQGTVTDDHASLGHYGFMVAFSFTVIGTGLLASLRPDGWRLTAWVAGLLPALLGATSVMYPDATSSLGPVWAFAATAWGVGFVAAAELAKDAGGRCSLGGPMALAQAAPPLSRGRGRVAAVGYKPRHNRSEQPAVRAHRQHRCCSEHGQWRGTMAGCSSSCAADPNCVGSFSPTQSPVLVMRSTASLWSCWSSSSPAPAGTSPRP